MPPFQIKIDPASRKRLRTWSRELSPSSRSVAPAEIVRLAAVAEPIPANIAMILSGHIHSFMSYEFAGARPSQLVVGESGDANDEITNPLTPGKMIAGLPIKRGFGLGDYGYAMAHAVQGGWDVTVYSITDKALARCALRGRGIHCRPTKR